MRLYLGSPVNSQPHNSSGLVWQGELGISSSDRLKYLSNVQRSSLGLNNTNGPIPEPNSLITQGLMNPNMASIYTFAGNNSIGVSSQMAGDILEPDDVVCGLFSKFPLKTTPPRLISNLDSGLKDVSHSPPRYPNTPQFSFPKSPHHQCMKVYREQQNLQLEKSPIVVNGREQSWND